MIAKRTIRTLLVASSFAAAGALAQKANPIDEASSHDGLT
jgi:hypothetical protein